MCLTGRRGRRPLQTYPIYIVQTKISLCLSNTFIQIYECPYTLFQDKKCTPIMLIGGQKVV